MQATDLRKSFRHGGTGATSAISATGELLLGLGWITVLGAAVYLLLARAVGGNAGGTT